MIHMKYTTNRNMAYRAPMVKVVEVAARNVLCESRPDSGVALGATGIEEIEGEDNLDW